MVECVLLVSLDGVDVSILNSVLVDKSELTKIGRDNWSGIGCGRDTTFGKKSEKYLVNIAFDGFFRDKFNDFYTVSIIQSKFDIPLFTLFS